MGFFWLFSGFYWVLLGFTGFYWVLLGFYQVLLCYPRLNWFLCSFLDFYWVLLGLTGFNWVLLGFTGFEWLWQVIRELNRVPVLLWSCGFFFNGLVNGPGATLSADERAGVAFVGASHWVDALYFLIFCLPQLLFFSFLHSLFTTCRRSFYDCHLVGRQKRVGRSIKLVETR